MSDNPLINRLESWHATRGNTPGTSGDGGPPREVTEVRIREVRHALRKLTGEKDKLTGEKDDLVSQKAASDAQVNDLSKILATREEEVPRLLGQARGCTRSVCDL